MAALVAELGALLPCWSEELVQRERERERNCRVEFTMWAVISWLAHGRPAGKSCQMESNHPKPQSSNTTVLLPATNTRSSRFHLTARASTSLSRSLPFLQGTTIFVVVPHACARPCAPCLPLTPATNAYCGWTPWSHKLLQVRAGLALN